MKGEPKHEIQSIWMNKKCRFRDVSAFFKFFLYFFFVGTVMESPTEAMNEKEGRI